MTEAEYEAVGEQIEAQAAHREALTEESGGPRVRRRHLPVDEPVTDGAASGP